MWMLRMKVVDYYGLSRSRLKEKRQKGTVVVVEAVHTQSQRYQQEMEAVRTVALHLSFVA